ncbi:MAG TPA: ABC transporter permease subunit [Spirochaetia bacterium]|nr:ABC transporter permease subunit [Spirochaetia bacterium]
MIRRLFLGAREAAAPAGFFRRRARGYLLFLVSVFLILLIWQVGAVLVRLAIILPTPYEVLRQLARIVSAPEFLRSVTATILRGAAGFAIAAGAGFVTGLAVGISRGVESFLKPLLTLIQATPVMSVILLALIWFQTGGVPVFVAFLMTFPVITLNVARGVHEVDGNLLEMARMYRLPFSVVLRRIYVPSVSPFVISAFSIALGLTWKVIIAAEVLSQPTFGIGTQLQEARVELETANVFAWTAVAVILAGLSDGVFYLILRVLTGAKPRDSKMKEPMTS